MKRLLMQAREEISRLRHDNEILRAKVIERENWQTRAEAAERRLAMLKEPNEEMVEVGAMTCGITDHWGPDADNDEQRAMRVRIWKEEWIEKTEWKDGCIRRAGRDHYRDIFRAALAALSAYLEKE